MTMMEGRMGDNSVRSYCKLPGVGEYGGGVLVARAGWGVVWMDE